jgi:hypothetical protein
MRVKTMLTPDDLDNVSQPHEQAAGDLEDATWAYIVKALADAETNRDHSSDDNFDASEWQNEMLGHLDDVIKYARHHGLPVFSEAIKETASKSATTSMSQQAENEWHMQQLAKLGVIHNPGTIEESKAVAKIIQSGKADTAKYLQLARKAMPKHAGRILKRIVSDATLSARNGSTPREALAKAAARWSKVGVPALVDKAGRRWHPDTYLRLVIQTQVQSVTNEVIIQRSRDYTGLVKVSSHAGCRPTHLQYQGNVYSVSGSADYPDLYDSTNFGSGGGLCGINCHHYVMTYVPGYDIASPDNLDPKSNNERYQLTQTQRKYERDVRAAKRSLVAAQSLGTQKDIDIAKRTVRARQARVRMLVREHPDELSRQYDREKNLI